MTLTDILIKCLMPAAIGFLAVTCVALYYRAEEYKVERDSARAQVVSFNNQLNAILQEYHQMAMREANIAQTAKEQQLQYLKSVTELQNATLSGDCMQAVGYLVDAAPKIVH